MGRTKINSRQFYVPRENFQKKLSRVIFNPSKWPE